MNNKMRRNLNFHLQQIRFGIIRFGSVRIPKLRYSVFRYFIRFGPPLTNTVVEFAKNSAKPTKE